MADPKSAATLVMEAHHRRRSWYRALPPKLEVGCSPKSVSHMNLLLQLCV
jgi:hypothetical protein